MIGGPSQVLYSTIHTWVYDFGVSSESLLLKVKSDVSPTGIVDGGIGHPLDSLPVPLVEKSLKVWAS